MSRSEQMYEVRDVDGKLVAVHVRIEKPGGGKSFQWRRDGKSGLQGLRVAELPLYGTHLLADRDHEFVVIVEGEKAADALNARDVLALGTVTGAASTPSPKSLACLANREVVLWPDADGDEKKHTGAAHMDRIAQRLAGVSKTTRVVDVSAWDGGFDAADFKDDDAALEELLSSASPWEGSTTGNGESGIDRAVSVVLALTSDATLDEIKNALVAMAHLLSKSPRSDVSIARDRAIRHLRSVVSCKSPAKIVDAVLSETSPKQEATSSHSAEIVTLVRERGVLFRDAEEKCYVDVQVDGHRETYALRGQSFKRWLASEYFDKFEVSPPSPSFVDAIGTLEGYARRDGQQLEVFVRFGASKDKRVFVDVGDKAWRVIEITANGWDLICDGPVRFVRPASMNSLPEPVRGGDLSALWDYLNVVEEDRPLVRAWLISAIVSRRPYSILALTGEQGSGKSTTARVLRDLLDPVKAPLRSVPREERDLVISASRCGVVAFDNVSKLSPHMSDALCRVSTGAGFATRQLYTDDSEYIFEGARPILLNGITNYVERDDLADRTVAIRVPRLEGRRREEEFWDKFHRALPSIFGALLDLACQTIEQMPHATASLIDEELPRMADFATVGVAVERALGGPTGLFLARYRSQRNEAFTTLLEEEPVAAAIIELMERESHWQGSATDLLRTLKGQDENTSKSLPKAPRGLTAALDRLTPALRMNGIQFRRSRGGKRGVTLKRMSSKSSQGERKHGQAEGQLNFAEGVGNRDDSEDSEHNSEASEPHLLGDAHVFPVVPVVCRPSEEPARMHARFDKSRSHRQSPPCDTCFATDGGWRTHFAAGCWNCNPPPMGASLLPSNPNGSG